MRINNCILLNGVQSGVCLGPCEIIRDLYVCLLIRLEALVTQSDSHK